LMTAPAPDLPRLRDAAVLHHRAGRLAEAERLYRQALALDPGHADSLNLLGVLAQQSGRTGLALDLLGQAIARDPAVAGYHANLGNMLGEAGRLDEAVASFGRALALDPTQPEAHSNLAHALAQLGRLDEAIACCRAALALRPGFAQALYNLGNLLWQAGRLEESVACCRQAVAALPGDAQAHAALGIALRQRGRLADAEASSRTAIALRPDLAEAHTNLAMVLIAQGDYPAGWREYEWRWRTPDFAPGLRHFAQPQWRGEVGGGRTLLLHAEQGFGDTLQFCRYAMLAASRGFRVVLEVQAPLLRLLRGLPLALGTTLATVPSALCYLRADAAQAASWRARLDALDRPGLRVGLVWAGNPRPLSPAAAAVDRRRSVPPAMLAPLVAVPGVHFVSLQKTGPAAPAAFGLTDCMAEVTDFADTAALVQNLDLVISVDTAVAHLAAALGRPVWLLDRFDHCWRWLAGRADSPWYPTLRVYRQPQPDDWASVVADVARDLRSLAIREGAAAPGGHPSPPA